MNEGNRSVKILRGIWVFIRTCFISRRRKYRADMEQSFPGKGHLRAPEEELRRLQRENENLKEDKAIFKKSLGHLSKTPRVKYQFIGITVRICGEEIVPGGWGFQERLLFMGKHKQE